MLALIPYIGSYMYMHVFVFTALRIEMHTNNKVCNLSWKLEQSQAQKRQVDHSLS